MHRHRVALVLLLLAFSVVQCKTMKQTMKHAKPCAPTCKGDLPPNTKAIRPKPIKFPPGITKLIVQNYIALIRLRDCPITEQTEPKGSGGFSCTEVFPIVVLATSAGITVPKIDVPPGSCVQWEATVMPGDLFTAAIEGVDFIDSDQDSETFQKTKNPEDIGNYCPKRAPKCVMYVGLPELKDPVTGGLLRDPASGELVGYRYALKVLYGMRSYTVDPELVVNCNGTCTE